MRNKHYHSGKFCIVFNARQHALACRARCCFVTAVGGAQTELLYLCPTAVTKFQSEPLSGALNTRGGKILQISPFIWKRNEMGLYI